MTTINSVNVGLSGATGTGNFAGSTSPTITSPAIITAIYDTNGNIILGLNPQSSAVNYVQIANDATTVAPVVSARGSDTNIILSLVGQGTGGAQVQGTTAGGNATAGYVGEFITSNVPFASAITMTTTTTSYNITSISLTAGDWDVWGNFFVFSSVNLATAISGWIGTSSVTPVDNSLTTKYTGTVFTVMAMPVPIQRINVTGNQTVYLSVNASFTSTSPTACGTISARRVR